MAKQNNSMVYFIIPVVAISAVIALLFTFIPAHEQISYIDNENIESPIPPQMYSSAHQLIGTGNKLGTYFPMGNIIADLLNKELNENDTIFKAIETNGSVDNIKLLENKQITLGMSENRIAEEAYKEEGSKLRVVWPLWYDVVHIVKTPEKYESQKEFPGIRRSFMGQKDSSTLRTTYEILRSLNQQRTNYEVRSSEVIPMLSAGKIGYAVIQAGMPNKTVADAVLFHECALYSFSNEQLEKIIPNVATSKKFIIPAGTYGNSQPDIQTIAIPNILLTNEEIPEEYINVIIETLVENAAKLRMRYSTLQTLPVNYKEAKEMLSHINVPLHKGTKMYLEEQEQKDSGNKEITISER